MVKFIIGLLVAIFLIGCNSSRTIEPQTLDLQAFDLLYKNNRPAFLSQEQLKSALLNISDVGKVLPKFKSDEFAFVCAETTDQGNILYIYAIIDSDMFVAFEYGDHNHLINIVFTRGGPVSAGGSLKNRDWQNRSGR